MCISVKIVVDKIFDNILSNKSQVVFLSKLLLRFNKLLKIDSVKIVHFNILIDCLKSNLAYILDTKNEKMLQNYSHFLKISLKNDYETVDPNDFYSQVIYDYFRMDTIDIGSYSIILDIYDTLLKNIKVDLTQIAFITELYSNMSLYSAQKQADLEPFLKLEEKCILLIKQMVKLVDKSKFNPQGN